MYMSTGVHRGQKRASGLSELELQATGSRPHRCWELNSGPQQEPYANALLTAEPYLSVYCFMCLPKTFCIKTQKSHEVVMAALQIRKPKGLIQWPKIPQARKGTG